MCITLMLPVYSYEKSIQGAWIALQAMESSKYAKLSPDQKKAKKNHCKTTGGNIEYSPQILYKLSRRDSLGRILALWISQNRNVVFIRIFDALAT